MITLLKLGKKTKVEFLPGKRGEGSLIDVADATVLGSFPDADTAKAEAQRQLATDPEATYCVRLHAEPSTDPEGYKERDRLIHWTCDLAANARKEKRAHWRAALLTIPVLLLLIWGILSSTSVPPFAPLTLALVTFSAFCDLGAMTVFNRLEALVVWIIVAILICLGVPTFQLVAEKRKKILERRTHQAAP